MEIFYFEDLDSTHLEAIRLLESGRKPPFAVTTANQNGGIGSRGSTWEGSEGALYLSVAINMDDLPSDLPQISIALFISFKIVLYLRDLGSNVWLKWPNDLYVDEKKIGGVMAKIDKNRIVWSVGINRNAPSCDLGALDVEIELKSLIDGLLRSVDKELSWKQIFSKVQIEFLKSKNHFTHIEGKRVSLKSAVLLNDGSLEIEGVRKFSLR